VGPGGNDIYLIKSEKGSWLCRLFLALDGKLNAVSINPAPQ
jgi:hypothetical protein